jgi:hypothetical protein
MSVIFVSWHGQVGPSGASREFIRETDFVKIINRDKIKELWVRTDQPLVMPGENGSYIVEAGKERFFRFPNPKSPVVFLMASIPIDVSVERVSGQRGGAIQQLGDVVE